MYNDFTFLSYSGDQQTKRPFIQIKLLSKQTGATWHRLQSLVFSLVFDTISNARLYLRWLRAFLLCMLRSLGFRLQLVALAPVRNYQASRGRQLCAASVVRNVATLLQCLGFHSVLVFVFLGVRVGSNDWMIADADPRGKSNYRKYEYIYIYVCVCMYSPYILR